VCVEVAVVGAYTILSLLSTIVLFLVVERLGVSRDTTEGAGLRCLLSGNSGRCEVGTCLDFTLFLVDVPVQLYVRKEWEVDA
jgi:hypothetical protein